MILAAALGAAALLPSSAQAAHVRISTASPPATGGAVGLLVLRHGSLEDLPPSRCPCDVTIYLRPPAIRIVGDGYRGLLVSDRTRVPGLVSIFDIAPTVRALERGGEPPVTSRADSNPEETVHKLDVRLSQIHEAHSWAKWILVAAVVAFALTALAVRLPFWGRAALLVPPVVMLTTLALSALELARPRTVGLVVLAAVAIGAPLLAALTRADHVLGAVLLSVFAVYLFVFLLSSETASLAVIGPHPEGGGRFYGFTNLVETLLLVPALAGATLLGLRALVPAGLLVLVVVGSSRLGADGGGVLVFGAGFLFLWLRLRRVPLTARNLALAGAGAVVLGLALVGLDAALGGSSHVTRALGGGPVAVAGDIAHRWNVSAHGVVASTHAVILIPVGAAVLTWLAFRRPRYATVDAVLVALVVSLLVNDSPRDVTVFGALSCAALRFWEDARRVQ